MNKLSVQNLATGETLAQGAWHATTYWQRMRGLLARGPLESGGGMVIEPCSSVHTWAMGYPLDLVFVDAENHVLKVQIALPPWRLSSVVRGARAVIELPEGVAEGTLPGHPLALEPA